MKKVFKNFEEILCAFFLIIMVLLVILNVILRYAFNYSLFWSEEVATICFVWSVFSSTGFRSKQVELDLCLAARTAAAALLMSPKPSAQDFEQYLFPSCSIPEC